MLVTGVEQPNLWLDVSQTFEVGLAGDALPRQPARLTADEVEARMRERIAEAGSRWVCRMAQAFLSIDLD